MPSWAWILIIVGGFLVIGFVAIASAVFWVGSEAPGTSVYVGGEVPREFVEAAIDVGAIREDEPVAFFYSDALLDVRNSFLVVTDDRVSVYRRGAVRPLVTMHFEEITDMDFVRDDSFWTDSQLTLTSWSGEVVSFPVSSDFDRDLLVRNHIASRMP